MTRSLDSIHELVEARTGVPGPLEVLERQIRSAAARRDEGPGAACRGKRGPTYFVTSESVEELRDKCRMAMFDISMLSCFMMTGGCISPAPAGMAEAMQDLDDWSQYGSAAIFQ